MSKRTNRRARNRKAAGAWPQAAQKNKLQENHSGNDAAAQRQRLKEFLKRHGKITTIQARHLLDVIAPAPRILELRRRGCRIETVRVRDFTPEGHPHFVALYVWQGEE